MRQVAEPELGARAPLGSPIVERSIAPERFGAEPDTLSFVLTNYIAAVIAQDTTAAGLSTALALLAEPEGGTFGHARLAETPRLRIVYTLPVQRSSP